MATEPKTLEGIDFIPPVDEKLEARGNLNDRNSNTKTRKVTKKLGRPKKKPEEKASALVSIYLTPNEKKLLLNSVASTPGGNMASVIRLHLLNTGFFEEKQ